MRPDAWPRHPADSLRWYWRHIRFWNWKQCGHITELEMRSALAAVRWRARSSSCLRARFVLFIDSHSSKLCLSKTRSSSRPLNAVPRQVSAIFLCSLRRPQRVTSCTRPATHLRGFCNERRSSLVVAFRPSWPKTLNPTGSQNAAGSSWSATAICSQNSWSVSDMLSMTKVSCMSASVALISDSHANCISWFFHSMEQVPF